MLCKISDQVPFKYKFNFSCLTVRAESQVRFKVECTKRLNGAWDDNGMLKAIYVGSGTYNFVSGLE